jgi:hypothetical protein
VATEANIADAAQRALQTQGQTLALDDLERLIPFARRILAEELDVFFTKEYSITLTNGVGTVSGSATNVDLIWTDYGRAVHSDGTDSTEVNILPVECTSRDLTYPRFSGMFWAVLEANGNNVTITVWQGDGATAAPDGTVTADFATVRSLADWPSHLETHLVKKVVELASRQAVAA